MESKREADGCPLQRLDFAGFAQEFLRRNPRYRAEYLNLIPRQNRENADAGQEVMARRWGCAFPCAPHIPAYDKPALWLPTEAPTIVILGAAPDRFADVAPLDFSRLPVIRNDRMLPSGRHVVLGDRDAPHRLWLSDIRPDQPLAHVIIRDASIDMRHAVAARFDRCLAGVMPRRLPPGLCPTPFQQQRMRLLLDILDVLSTRNRERPTTYDIARLLIYRHMTIKRGMDWKASSERRRTQRLVDEARALMNGGYRSLLRGQMAVRQKTPAPFSRSP